MTTITGDDLLKQFQELADKMNKQAGCQHCGRCPTCGRGPWVPYPQYPQWPYYLPATPTYPYDIWC